MTDGHDLLGEDQKDVGGYATDRPHRPDILNRTESIAALIKDQIQ